MDRARPGSMDDQLSRTSVLAVEHVGEHLLAGSVVVGHDLVGGAVTRPDHQLLQVAGRQVVMGEEGGDLRVLRGKILAGDGMDLFHRQRVANRDEGGADPREGNLVAGDEAENQHAGTPLWRHPEVGQAQA